MRAAYYTTTAGATGLTGNLQCVSLVEFDGYNINDVTATLSADGAGPNAASSRTNGNGGYSGNTNYLLTYKTAGVTYPNIQINNVPVSGGSAATFDVGEEEVVLDIAQAIGMAPGLSQVRVYIAPQESTWTTSGPYLFPSNSDDLAVFEQMITDFNNQVGCNQASISWNWSPENPLTDPDNTEFEEFGAIGISFFSASGDYGSWDAVSGGVDECTYGNCYVYPQESPYLTAVGGTDLTTNGAGGSWASESGWSNSGGGISLDNFPIPSYQSGSAPGTYPINEIYSNDTSTSDRNAPDVAMERTVTTTGATQILPARDRCVIQAPIAIIWAHPALKAARVTLRPVGLLSRRSSTSSPTTTASPRLGLSTPSFTPSTRALTISPTSTRLKEEVTVSIRSSPASTTWSLGGEAPKASR